jgi:hypothetical protein
MTTPNQTNEEINVKGKHPPRIWVDDLLGRTCGPLNKVGKDLAYPDSERYLVYISESEHKAILGERINEGYEWTRKELNKRDEEIAALKTYLKSVLDESFAKPSQTGNLESKLARAVETLEWYVEAFKFPNRKAHPENYKSDLAWDSGSRARDTLTEIKGENVEKKKWLATNFQNI